MIAPPNKRPLTLAPLFYFVLSNLRQRRDTPDIPTSPPLSFRGPLFFCGQEKVVVGHRGEYAFRSHHPSVVRESLSISPTEVHTRQRNCDDTFDDTYYYYYYCYRRCETLPRPEYKTFANRGPAVCRLDNKFVRQRSFVSFFFFKRECCPSAVPGICHIQFHGRGFASQVQWLLTNEGPKTDFFLRSCERGDTRGSWRAFRHRICLRPTAPRCSLFSGLFT
jgi:hypothetical protein